MIEKILIYGVWGLVLGAVLYISVKVIQLAFEIRADWAKQGL